MRLSQYAAHQHPFAVHLHQSHVALQHLHLVADAAVASDVAADTITMVDVAAADAAADTIKVVDVAAADAAADTIKVVDVAAADAAVASDAAADVAEASRESKSLLAKRLFPAVLKRPLLSKEHLKLLAAATPKKLLLLHLRLTLKPTLSRVLSLAMVSYPRW